MLETHNSFATSAEGRSTSPTWLPWIPTREQVEALKAAELKIVCEERGLPKSGRKAELQDRLLSWTRKQRTLLGKETNDIHALLKRRELIHKEKREGKQVEKEQQLDDLSFIHKVFQKPSTDYSNVQVKEMYAAAKKADQQGDHDLGTRILQELVHATPHDARVFRRLARLQKERGDTLQAIATLKQGLELHPDNGYLWHALGHIENPVENWQQAIKVDPSFAFAYHSLGTLQHTQGRIANAMKTLQQGLKYCPTNHRLHHALGDLYRDAKMLEMAKKSYEKALDCAPDASKGFAYNGLAYVAYELGQIESCRKYLRKSILLNEGRYANGWMMLAQMEEAEGEIDAARVTCMAGAAQYEAKLLSRYSDTEWTHEDILNADPELVRSKIQECVPTFRSGDRFSNVYRNWIRLEGRRGDSEAAEEVYKRGITLFPNNWKLSVDMAEHFRSKGRYDDVRALFSRACETTCAEPFGRWAAFEMRMGNFTGARQLLYEGSRLDILGDLGNNDTLVELSHLWAVCEWRLNEPDRAEVLLEHALRMSDRPSERASILYTLASLKLDREELEVARHYVALCIQTDSFPCGQDKPWNLWAKIAEESGDTRLAHECTRMADELRNRSRPEHPVSSARVQDSVMEDLLRREPWHHVIFPEQKRRDYFSLILDTIE